MKKYSYISKLALIACSLTIFNASLRGVHSQTTQSLSVKEKSDKKIELIFKLIQKDKIKAAEKLYDLLSDQEQDTTNGVAMLMLIAMAGGLNTPAPAV